MRHGKLKFVLVVLMVASVIGVAVAALSQSTPTVIPPALPSLTGPCTSLVQEGTLSPVTGIARLDCGSSGGAFNVNIAASFIPSFVLPTVTTGTVGPLQVAPSGQCSSGLLTLTSGSSTPLQAGSYDYCLGYADFPAAGGEAIPSFTIAWS